MSGNMIRGIAASLDRTEADRAVVLFAGRRSVFSAGDDLATFSRPVDVRRTL
ncbi:hypothetical protein OHB12_31115 [Nocardia sp. NBC_01730]|uniref:hypothetical protein n=1 Tax=Nocardia sp. NBC_01730 TaxID=2975998 RepID=UPI002E13D246|nr:hypothetical protein OHB12_31115 [Nocardia sp. NBC_01730]